MCIPDTFTEFEDFAIHNPLLFPNLSCSVSLIFNLKICLFLHTYQPKPKVLRISLTNWISTGLSQWIAILQWFYHLKQPFMITVLLKSFD